jgi:hypothetical protein
VRVRSGVSWAAGSLLVALGCVAWPIAAGSATKRRTPRCRAMRSSPIRCGTGNRGLTIAASAEAIWPWLVQMGYGRAGWYTPEAFDRFMHRWVWRLEQTYPFQPSPWWILPEHQQLAVRDIVADGPNTRPTSGSWRWSWPSTWSTPPCGIPGAASPSTHRRGGPCSPAGGAARRRAVPGVLLAVRTAPAGCRPDAAAATGPQQRVAQRLAGLLDVPIGLVDV